MQLLMQDIERQADGSRLKEGVSPDRMVSVHDPEMRHGRKSARRRFDGHKGAIALDPESQLITAADVLPGNAQDHERALELVEQAEANADVEVEETVGDCAYGDSETRQLFADAGRKLVAKVANRRGGAQFPKEDFQIDLESMSCTCPAGQETQKVVSISSGERYGAPGVPLRAFRFDAAICDACPLRPKCVRARPGKGRLVMLHPHEGVLQEARAFQHSDSFAPYRKLRQVAEHRLARLMQLGVRQARYIGRTKTLFQLLMAATVANLTLVATRTGLMRDRHRRKAQPSAHIQHLLSILKAVRTLFTARFTLPEPSFSATLLVVKMAGAAVVLAACGLGVGLAHALRSDDSSEITRLLGAQLASLPAVWVVAGLAVALFGLVPQAASLAWAALVGFLFLGILVHDQATFR